MIVNVVAAVFVCDEVTVEKYLHGNSFISLVDIMFLVYECG